MLMGRMLLLDGRVKESYQQLQTLINENNRNELQQRLDTLCRHQLLKRTTLTLFMDALVLHI